MPSHKKSRTLLDNHCHSHFIIVVLGIMKGHTEHLTAYRSKKGIGRSKQKIREKTNVI